MSSRVIDYRLRWSIFLYRGDGNIAGNGRAVHQTVADDLMIGSFQIEVKLAIGCLISAVPVIMRAVGLY